MSRLRFIWLATLAAGLTACARAQERGDRIGVMQSGLAARMLWGADREASKGQAERSAPEPIAPEETALSSAEPSPLGGASGSADVTDPPASPTPDAPKNELPEELPAKDQKP